MQKKQIPGTELNVLFPESLLLSAVRLQQVESYGKAGHHDAHHAHKLDEDVE